MDAMMKMKEIDVAAEFQIALSRVVVATHAT
jgi:hypothetical protein